MIHNPDTLHFHVQRNLAMNAYDVFMYKHVEDTVVTLSDLHFKTVPAGQQMPDTPLRPSVEEAQKLMNAMWEAGLRPSALESPEGTLKAQQAHIKDLRGILNGIMSMMGASSKVEPDVQLDKLLNG